MTRIVLVCRCIPLQRPGGMPFVAWDRAIYLKKYYPELDIHFLTTGEESEFEIDGVTVHQVGGEPIKYSGAFAEGIVGACKKLNPDVIHTDSADCSNPWWTDRLAKCQAVTLHGFGLGAKLTDLNISRITGEKKEIDIHDLLEEQKKLALFDVQVGISKSEHWVLSDVYALKNARLIYNPIPEYFFGPRTKYNNDASYVMAEVSHGTERRLDTALEKAEKHGVKVSVVRGRKRNEMPSILKQSAGVIIPTFYARGFDLLVAEALACHRQVLAFGTGSYFWEHDNNGVFEVVTPGDYDSLFEKAALRHTAENYRIDEAYEIQSSRFHPAIHCENWLSGMNI